MTLLSEIRFNLDDYSYGPIPRSITLPLEHFRPTKQDELVDFSDIKISATMPYIYYGFSNMARVDLVIDGTPWKSVEHYMQAQKYVQYPAFAFAISECDTPQKARQLGNLNWLDEATTIINYQTYRMTFLDVVDQCGLHISPRPDWNQVRFFFLSRAISAKFEQYKCFRDALVATGSYILDLDISEYDSVDAKNEVLYILQNIRNKYHH